MASDLDSAGWQSAVDKADAASSLTQADADLLAASLSAQRGQADFRND